MNKTQINNGTNPANFVDGYIGLSRSSSKSEVWFKDHLYWKTWTWMLMRANHTTIEKNGFLYRRGELYTTYEKIINTLTVYNRKGKKSHASLKQVRGMLDWFVDRKMIEKTPVRGSNFAAIFRQCSGEHGIFGTDQRADIFKYGGLRIRVINYDSYQNFSNYKRESKGRPKGRRKGRLRADKGHDNKNDIRMNKNDKENNKEYVGDVSAFQAETYSPSKTKKTEASKVKEFLGWYGVEWSKKFGQPYSPRRADRNRAMKELKPFSIDRLKDLAVRFFKDNDPWVKKTGHEITVFVSQIPRLVSTEKKRPIGLDDFSKWK